MASQTGHNCQTSFLFWWPNTVFDDDHDHDDDGGDNDDDEVSVIKTMLSAESWSISWIALYTLEQLAFKFLL